MFLLLISVQVSEGLCWVELNEEGHSKWPRQTVQAFVISAYNGLMTSTNLKPHLYGLTAPLLFLITPSATVSQKQIENG